MDGIQPFQGDFASFVSFGGIENGAHLIAVFDVLNDKVVGAGKLIRFIQRMDRVFVVASIVL